MSIVQGFTGRSGTRFRVFNAVKHKKESKRVLGLAWMPSFAKNDDNDNSEHLPSFCTTVLVGTIWLKEHVKLQFVNWDSWMIPTKKLGHYYMTKPILEWHVHSFTYYFLDTFSWIYSVFFAFCTNLIATEQLFCCEQLNSCQGWQYMMMD